MPVQDSWRYCNKCQGLFFGPNSQGVCPAGGAHSNVPSGNYVLIDNTPQAVGQHDWLWCSQCQGLFYGGSSDQAGRCPGGEGEFGSHDGSISGKYTLFNNDPGAFGQADWLWCNKCQGLFFGSGSLQAGVCPSGGGHDGSKSGEYKLMHYTSVVQPPPIIDYATTYGKLRAGVLSRHFALNRFFRTNYVLIDGLLHTAMTPQELLSKDETTQKKERWRIQTTYGGNPLMLGGWLLISLAVESHLGNADSLKILKKALFTLSTLFKFKGNNFDGYILRWDPTISESWEIGKIAGEGELPVEIEKPVWSTQFLIGQNKDYLYCTPSNDPRAVWGFKSDDDPERGVWDEFRDHFRLLEPSMDELVGLIAAYSMIFQLVKDPAVQTMVKDQVHKLADYLNAHAYILVRPYGGFVAQGPSGASVAFEYPFNRVFSRITGKSYSYNVSFEDAMRKAKVWQCVEGPMNRGSVGGVVGTALIALLTPILTPVFTGLGLSSLAIASIITDFQITPIELGRAVGLLNSVACFDTDERVRGEFAFAYLLKQLEPRRRFGYWIDNTAGGSGRSWSIGFIPFSALTALDDSDTVVKTHYLNWLKNRRRHSEAPPKDVQPDFINWGANTCFASAVALLLGGGIEEEKKLAFLLKTRYKEIHDNYKDDIPVREEPDTKFLEECLHSMDIPSALDCMVGLSLAWLYAKRRADSGNPVTTPEFPIPPNNISEHLPKAVVPQEVLESWNSNGIKFRIEDIQNTFNIEIHKDADLFTDNAPEKSPTPSPILTYKGLDDKMHGLANTQLPPNIDKTIVVKESDRDVDTGIDLNYGDAYEFSDISGTIWAGVALTGRNGPDGWADRVDYDVKFPLHGSIDPVNAHPFCLLGKLNNYFFIGSRGRAKEHFIYLHPLRLKLRINDDSPGNGNGEFSCRVKVWRA